MGTYTLTIVAFIAAGRYDLSSSMTQYKWSYLEVIAGVCGEGSTKRDLELRERIKESTGVYHP